jgi:hypothetical protein
VADHIPVRLRIDAALRLLPVQLCLDGFVVSKAGRTEYAAIHEGVLALRHIVLSFRRRDL